MVRPSDRFSSTWLLMLTLFFGDRPIQATDHKDIDPLEDFLLQATVLDSRDIGTGITGSLQLTLEHDNRVRQAIFKDFDRASDSWRREVAAYQLDRLIGLGMVPPTVERTYGGRRGCLQLWIEGTTLDAAAVPVDLETWRRQVSEMWLFDYLTGNIDRHVRNALMTPDGRLVLIDNSKAFQIHPQIMAGIRSARGATRARFWMTSYDASQETFETTYRPQLLDQIRSLTRESLKQGLGRWTGPSQRRSLLERRDDILHVLGVP